VALVRQEHYIVITIEDDGAGVAEADKHAILIRGQRLDTYAKGQGLGLAIVNELIDLYQAKLDITNSELGGAKFMIRFVQTSSLGD
jgi:two-component system sensor histidine kinase PhoQ